MAKVCPDCGRSSDEVKFYPRLRRCAKCHDARMIRDRKKPGRREQVREANRAWLKVHPEINRRNVAAFRARRRALQPIWSVPPDRALVREAVERLGVTKQYVSLLIDQGQLGAVRERGRWLISRVDLERKIEERTVRVEKDTTAGREPGME